MKDIEVGKAYSGGEGYNRIRFNSYGSFHISTINPGTFSTHDIVLTKRKADGSVIWSRVLGTTFIDLTLDMDISNDGLIYIVGYSTNAAANQVTQLYVLDQTGALVDTKMYSISGTNYAAGRIRVSDSYIYLCGTVSGRASVQCVNRSTLTTIATKTAAASSVSGILQPLIESGTENLVFLSPNATLANGAHAFYKFSSTATIVFKTVISLSGMWNQLAQALPQTFQYGSDFIIVFPITYQTATGTNKRGVYLLRYSGSSYTVLRAYGISGTGTESLIVKSSVIVGDKIYILSYQNTSQYDYQLCCISLTTTAIQWIYKISVPNQTAISITSDGITFHILWQEAVTNNLTLTVYDDVEDILTDPRVTVESSLVDKTAWGAPLSGTPGETWSTLSVTSGALTGNPNITQGPYQAPQLALIREAGWVSGG